MAALDGRAWRDGLAFRSHGQRIGVRVDAPGLVARIRETLPPGARPMATSRVQRLYSVIARRPHGGGRGGYEVWAQADRIAHTPALGHALRSLENDIELFVAERSRNRVFVHAGVVAWQERAIVIPGRSHSGKSRLVAALLAAGAAYYSDEYAPIDARGRVDPYPVPLRLRRCRGEGSRPAAPRPGASALPALPVGLIVVTEYVRGSRWHHRTLTPGRATLEVLEHAVAARRYPRRVMGHLAVLTARARTIRGRRGPAREAARRILALASRPPSLPALPIPKEGLTR